MSKLPPQSEKDFQAEVIELAQANGFELVYHTHDSQRSRAGFPDLIMVKKLSENRYRLLIAELKSDKGKCSKAQLDWLEGFQGVKIMSTHIWRPKDYKEIVRKLTAKED